MENIVQISIFNGLNKVYSFLIQNPSEEDINIVMTEEISKHGKGYYAEAAKFEYLDNNCNLDHNNKFVCADYLDWDDLIFD